MQSNKKKVQETRISWVNAPTPQKLKKNTFDWVCLSILWRRGECHAWRKRPNWRAVLLTCHVRFLRQILQFFDGNNVYTCWWPDWLTGRLVCKMPLKSSKVPRCWCKLCTHRFRACSKDNSNNMFLTENSIPTYYIYLIYYFNKQKLLKVLSLKQKTLENVNRNWNGSC